MRLRVFLVLLLSIVLGTGVFAWLNVYTSVLSGSETDFSVLSFREITLYEIGHPSSGQISTQSARFGVYDLQLDKHAQLQRDTNFSALTGWDFIRGKSDETWRAVPTDTVAGKPSTQSKLDTLLPLKGIYPMTSLSHHTAECSQLSMAVFEDLTGIQNQAGSVLTLQPGSDREIACTLNVGFVFSKHGVTHDGSQVSAYLPAGSTLRLGYTNEDLVWEKLSVKRLVGRMAQEGHLELPKNGKCRALPNAVLDLAGDIELTRLTFGSNRSTPHIQALLFAKHVDEASVDRKDCARPGLNRFISSWALIFASAMGLFLASYEAVKIQRKQSIALSTHNNDRTPGRETKA